MVSDTQVAIFEDEPIGYPILQVIAEDLDSGDNGRVSYGITAGNQAGHFNLDSALGQCDLLAATNLVKSFFYQ